MSNRPEPLRFYAAVRAGFLVLMGGQVWADLLPVGVTGFLLLLAAAADAVVNEWYRDKVTPLAAPQTADGTPLVPLVIPDPVKPRKRAAAKRTTKP